MGYDPYKVGEYHYVVLFKHGGLYLLHMYHQQWWAVIGVNVRLLSGDKKNIAVNLFSKLGWELGLYYASYDDFHLDILAWMYTYHSRTAFSSSL